jgi:hypothetical protein
MSAETVSALLQGPAHLTAGAILMMSLGGLLI